MRFEIESLWKFDYTIPLQEPQGWDLLSVYVVFFYMEEKKILGVIRLNIYISKDKYIKRDYILRFRLIFFFLFTKRLNFT